MSLLESFLRADPPRHFSEGLLQNLIYMYELIADKGGRERRLKVLEGVARRCGLDDLLASPIFSPNAGLNVNPNSNPNSNAPPQTPVSNMTGGGMENPPLSTGR